MAIAIRLHERLCVINVPLTWLAEETRTSTASLRRLKNERAKSIKLDLLDTLCEKLHCEVGDLLVYEDERVTRRMLRWKRTCRSEEED